jgi:hypothetical protein
MPRRTADSFPDPSTPGDPRTLAAIARRTPQSGTMSIVTTPSGRILQEKRKRASRAKGTPPPFYPKVKGSQADGWKITFKSGRLVTYNPSTDTEAIKTIIPKIGGVDMDAATPPSLSIESGQWAYLFFQTDSKGIINEDEPPSIIADDPDKPSTHHIPPSPDDDMGVDGAYYIPLAKFEIDDDSPKVTPLIQSDFIHTPYLWSGRDAEGDGESISPRYKPDEVVWEFPKVAGKKEIKVTREEGSVEISLDVTSSAHIRYFEVYISLNNQSSGGIRIERAPSPYLELWIWKGLVYLSQPEDFVDSDNPRDIYSAVPNEIPV